MKFTTATKHRLIGGSVALSGVLPLLLAINPVFDAVAFLLLIGGGSYSLGAHLVGAYAREQEERVHRLQVRHQQLVAADTNAIKRDKKWIKEERQKVTQELADAKRQAKTLESALQEQFDIEIEQAKKLLQAKYQELTKESETALQNHIEELEAQKQAELEALESAYEEEEEAFLIEIGELKQLIVDRDNYLKEEFGKSLDDTDTLLASEIKGVQDAKDLATKEIHKRDLIIQRLQGQVELLGAPRKFRGSSADDQIANKVLDILLTQGIRVGGDNWDRKYHQLFIWLEPMAAIKSDIESVLEDIQVRLGLYSKPTVEIDRGLYRLTLDTDKRAPIDPKVAKIPEPPLSKLENAISEAIHLRIVAPTGSGKSVLLGNMVNYLTATYLSEYELYDPKVTAREVWGNLEPTYYGAECLYPFFGLTLTCLKRINEVIDARKANVPDPVFDPQFHIIDELEFLYGLSEVSPDKDLNPKTFKINLKTGLKVGREHKIKLLFVTQSPLPMDLNLRKNDLFNTGSIFLGKCILEALGSELLSDVAEEKRHLLRQQYKARLARGDKWTFLFYDPQRPTDAWLGTCPAPGHYAGAKIPGNQTGQAPGQSLPFTAETLAVEGAKVAPVVVGNAPQISGNDIPAQELEALLQAGTHCPDCGAHCTSYKTKKPTKKGEVRVRCSNKNDCNTDIFKWNVLKAWKQAKTVSTSSV
ncbi:MAG: hypothetical protein AAGE59_26010 [Cyanobacteria bacterium P01_F01_bin.86]